MHLRIYLWLSCVVLAGYVRATEDGVAGESPTANTVGQVQNDGNLSSDRDLFIDDDGSGVDPDESSGSGWGAGPGPDDEDGRGSGDVRSEVPDDDEDYSPPTTTAATIVTDSDFYDEFEARNRTFSEITDYIQPEEHPIAPEIPSTVYPIPTDSDQFDVVIPNTKSKASEGSVDETRGAGEEQPSRPDQTDISITGDDIGPSTDQEQAGTNVETESRPADNGVFIMNAKTDDHPASFFAQPGILAAVIGGAVVGLLCAILVVMFIVYRMRKKDEGSYALDEPKRSPAAASYGKGHNNREFYA